MSQDSVILTKSLKLAARIVKLYRYLCKEKHETTISKLIIRSGTSIGAAAISSYLGFSSFGHFSQVIKNGTVRTPTEYQEKYSK